MVDQHPPVSPGKESPVRPPAPRCGGAGCRHHNVGLPAHVAGVEIPPAPACGQSLARRQASRLPCASTRTCSLVPMCPWAYASWAGHGGRWWRPGGNAHEWCPGAPGTVTSASRMQVATSRSQTPAKHQRRYRRKMLFQYPTLWDPPSGPRVGSAGAQCASPPGPQDSLLHQRRRTLNSTVHSTCRTMARRLSRGVLRGRDDKPRRQRPLIPYVHS